MATLDTSKMRPGHRVEIDAEPYQITQYQHVKPGKGGAFVRLKLKNLLSGAVLDRTLKAGESLEVADVAERPMQYLYSDGASFVFMDQESYDQVEVPPDVIENNDLLTESCEVQVLVYKGRPVGASLPNFAVLEVTETDPKGSHQKPATLESGAVVQVPGFIERGDRIKIDTRDRKYVERA